MKNFFKKYNTANMGPCNQESLGDLDGEEYDTQQRSPRGNAWMNELGKSLGVCLWEYEQNKYLLCVSIWSLLSLSSI